MKNTTLAVKPFPYSELLRSVEDPEVLVLAAEVGEELKRPIYLVGGPVRDFFLKQPVKDLDLVVEGEAGEVAEKLARKLKGTVKARSLFHTFKIAYPGGTLDLAMARKEVYPQPAALPEVCPAGIAEDLLRRDFTANAMAVGLSGPFRRKLLDPLDGLRDLERGILRVLHPDSFVDDPTRIFRAARYAVRFRWSLSRESHRALGRAYLLETPKRLSPARILGELKRILAEPDPERVLLCLEELGLWLALDLPAPPSGAGELWRLSRSLWGEKSLLKALAVALACGKEDNMVRLGLAPSEARVFSDSWSGLAEASEKLKRSPRPSERYRLLKRFPREVVLGFFLKHSELGSIFKEFLYSERTRPELTGRDLGKLFGLSPGPRMGRILAELLRARLDGEVKTREDEERLVLALLRSEEDVAT